MHPKVAQIHRSAVKKDVPEFRAGDTVSVDFKVIEGNKERVQTFTGGISGRSLVRPLLALVLHSARARDQPGGNQTMKKNIAPSGPTSVSDAKRQHSVKQGDAPNHRAWPEKIKANGDAVMP
jgi:hypothetical protein